MKIVFMGNPQFAVPSLRRLALSNHSISVVVTNPPKPSGRGKQLQPTPVALAAQESGLTVMEIDDLHATTTVSDIGQLGADVFVVVAYRILPKSLLTVPRMGTINLHGSLLPKYRGAAPIQWALINGEKATGLTTFLIEPTVDTGNILLQRKIDIATRDDFGTLSRRMSSVGAELLVETLSGFEHGVLKPFKQNDVDATTAPKITPDLARIKWTMPALNIQQFIRGLAPIPGMHTQLAGQRLKVLRAQVICNDSGQHSGVVTEINRDGIQVQAGAGQLLLQEIQMAGKKRMTALAFLRGYTLAVGTTLGK